MHPARLRLTVAALLLWPVAACSSPGGNPAAPPPSGPAPTPPQAPVTGLPSADAATPAPPGAVTPADLPTAEDLWAPTGSAWQEGPTTSSSGTMPSSACQRSKWESTGPIALHLRAFTGGTGATASAVVLSYPDEAAARTAVDAMTQWVAECGVVLASNGATDVRPVLSPTPVDALGAQAQIAETRWKGAGGTAASESQGIVRVGDRVAFVAMRRPSATDGGDVAEHPMTRTLPAVARRLAA